MPNVARVARHNHSYSFTKPRAMNGNAVEFYERKRCALGVFFSAGGTSILRSKILSVSMIDHGPIIGHSVRHRDNLLHKPKVFNVFISTPRAQEVTAQMQEQRDSFPGRNTVERYHPEYIHSDYRCPLHNIRHHDRMYYHRHSRR